MKNKYYMFFLLTASCLLMFSCSHMNQEKQTIHIKHEEDKFMLSIDNQKHISMHDLTNKIHSNNITVYLPFKKVGREDSLNIAIKKELLKYINIENIHYIYPTSFIDLNTHHSFSQTSGYGEITAREIVTKISNNMQQNKK